MTLMTNEAALQLEVIKLLLQLAWADLGVHDEEAKLVLERARSFGLPDDAIAEIASCLNGSRPLPPPDMQLLKSRRVEVLEACRALLWADARLTHDERELLDVVEAALRSP